MSDETKDNISIKEIAITDIRLKKTAAVARQILFSFFDVYRHIIPVFDKASIYRIPFQYYDKFREKDKNQYFHEMSRLEKLKFVKKYFDGKEYFLELTPKGKKHLKKYLTQEIEIDRPKNWDKKWRVVIYDIINDKKDRREILREKLEQIGFLQLQESVYVYPFDCLTEINLIKNMYYLVKNVQYLVCERIETEIDLIEKFYDNGILTQKMLK